MRLSREAVRRVTGGSSRISRAPRYGPPAFASPQLHSHSLSPPRLGHAAVLVLSCPKHESGQVKSKGCGVHRLSQPLAWGRSPAGRYGIRPPVPVPPTPPDQGDDPGDGSPVQNTHTTNTHTCKKKKKAFRQSVVLFSRRVLKISIDNPNNLITLITLITIITLITLIRYRSKV